jgi:hypothetical protein
MKERIKRTVFVISLIVFANASSSAQKNIDSHPTLRGDAAIEKLQRDGQSEGLLEAFKAASGKDSLAESLFGQSAKIFAADGGSFHNFGFSVAISGNTAIIGAYQHSPSGAAYVFVRNNSIWSLQQKLTASDAGQFDEFGFSVAIDGDTVVIGADQDDIGMNAEQGSAYVFVRNGTTWTEQQKLVASDGDGSDFFGCSVGIAGDSVIVGAYGGILAADMHRGAAYVFVRSGTTWTQQQKLTASDGEINDGFGFSVGISGNTAIAGAWNDAVVEGQQGSAYVFVRSGTTWTQQQKLAASDGSAADVFGISSAIEGDTVIVGAYFAGAGANFQGAAYVYVRSGTVWTEQQKLVGSDAQNGDQFGRSVAITGNTAVIGAGDDNGGGANGRGSAYVFARSGTTWTEFQHLFASDETVGAHMGVGVGISGNTIVVGAPRADVTTSANFLAPEANDQGAVYVFVPNVFISGRVMTSSGLGVPNAIVRVAQANGTTLTKRTNSFGYYRFDEINVGQTVTISVVAKEYQFASQMVQVTDNLSNVDFVAMP